MGTNDAAEFLGLSVPALKYHLRLGHLSGQLIGRSLVFTRTELERFAAIPRPRGRPRRADLQSNSPDTVGSMSA